VRPAELIQGEEKKGTKRCCAGRRHETNKHTTEEGVTEIDLSAKTRHRSQRKGGRS